MNLYKDWRVEERQHPMFGYQVTVEQGRWARLVVHQGHNLDVANLISTAPELAEALHGCLAQLLGPVMVHGDGIGYDGTKTGLSGEEFNALQKSRIEKAKAALRKAGIECPPTT